MIILAVIVFLFVGKFKSNGDDTSNYIAKEQYYQIKSYPSSESPVGIFYEYIVFEEDKIICKESNLVYRPNIDCYHGVIRVQVAWGTNQREVQYYNVITKMLSPVYLVPSVYADYFSNYDSSESVDLFASFEYDEDNNPVLVIHDLFSGNAISTIKRNFISPTSGANSMLFLNENAIYIDYDTLDELENRSNKMEIVVFGTTSEPVIVTSQSCVTNDSSCIDSSPSQFSKTFSESIATEDINPFCNPDSLTFWEYFVFEMYRGAKFREISSELTYCTSIKNDDFELFFFRLIYPQINDTRPSDELINEYYLNKLSEMREKEDELWDLFNDTTPIQGIDFS